MSRYETTEERKASRARARASGHSGVLRPKEKPQFAASDIRTGQDFAAWVDAAASGKTIYEIAAVCGGLDAAYDYVAALGTNVFKDGSCYKLSRNVNRASLPNVKGNA